MEDLIIRRQIKEDNKRSMKKGLNLVEVKANMVERGQTSKSKKNKFGEGFKWRPTYGISKKQKFQGNYFICDKVGHKSIDYKLLKKKKKKNYERGR